MHNKRLIQVNLKVKVKVHIQTDHGVLEGDCKYRPTLSLTSALDEVGWSTPRPGRFTPEKGPVPIV